MASFLNISWENSLIIVAVKDNKVNSRVGGCIGLYHNYILTLMWKITRLFEMPVLRAIWDTNNNIDTSNNRLKLVLSIKINDNKSEIVEN